jgi:beta-galactosidase GanA
MKIKQMLICFLLGISVLSKAQLPYLQKSANATKMMVDGKPFIILGGELHNSTGTDKAALKNALKEAKSYNLNTVLAYAYWELIEPTEGRYNFELIDYLLTNAKQENLKVILVWFGSWKSTSSSYVPEWVKTNPRRFERYTLQNGKTLEMLSAFNDENRNADSKAYVALMRHLKDFDKQHTVIMTQVQNEPGCFDNYRDFSPAAQKAWQSAMPSDMIIYLQKNKEKLFPALEKAWTANGNKTTGTWEEILGKSTDQGEYKFYTEELFMAYNYSKYINYIAQEGRKVHNLPAFCNGWLYNNRGFYPHGTINPHVLDAYRAGGSALDFYSPNVYTIEYDELYKNYTLGGNTLFVPESLLLSAGALYAIGAFNAIGFAPFGIDGEKTKSKESANNLNLLKSSYKAISQMTRKITENYGNEKMKAVYLNPSKESQNLQMGDYILTATNSRKGGFSIDFGKSLENEGKNKMSFGPPSPEAKDEKTKAIPAGPFGPLPEDLSSAIVIQNTTDEFYVVGYGVKVHFELKEGIKFEHLGYASIEEGYFENDKFISTKRWNGDEQKASLPSEKITILKIKLYRL